MNRFVLLFLFFLTLIFKSYSQKLSREDYLIDLTFVYKNLQKTASYKTQKKNQEKLNNQFNQLNKTSNHDFYLLDAIENYYKLVDCLEDYHNVIASNSETYSYQELGNKETLDKLLMESKDYYRKSTLNLDSLVLVLKNKQLDDYEGIYFYEDSFTVAVVKSNDKLVGIILESKIPSWSRGEEIFYLIPRGGNKFRIITGTFVDKQISSSLDHFENAVFFSFGWRKEPVKYQQQRDKAHYALKELQSNITYVKVSSFSASNRTLNEAKDFYNRLNETELGENIIVDLRNNGGGGDRNSSILYQILKKYKGNIYVLTNFNTVSNAEQFVLKLRTLPNVRVLGKSTRGMLTYGRNYGESSISPSKRIKISFTDMKDNWKTYLPFEGIGISPDIYLAEDSDWIEQTIGKIKDDRSIIKD